MDLNLKNKVVVISGGAGKEGSIGETIVRKLAEEGAIPVILDLSERGAAYAEKLQGQGIDALFLKTNVTKPDQVEQAIEAIVEKYGRINILINHVGGNDGVGLDGSYEEFVASLHLNLISYFLLTKYALPYLKASKGNILNIGSKVALTGQGGTSAYAAAKGGVLALTREWAVDLLPDQIRVNALLISECWTPAYDEWIQTLENGAERLENIRNTIPFGKRMTEPEEIADTVLFVISERSSHTTGQFVFVDGGYRHLDRALGGKA